MAQQNKQNKNEELTKALNPSEDIARFKLGEVGSIGLPIFNGVSNAEIKEELNHPQSVQTYKLMSYHPAVNAPLSLFTNMVGNLTYRVLPPKDATEEEEKQAKIVATMLDDMEHSFEDFILEAMTCTTYGWAVTEKVFRKRTLAAGSKYNDGLIGIKKLPLRAQESIVKFVFDSTGNEVIGVQQSLSGVADNINRWIRRSETDVTIPKSKFLLFTLGKNRGNPYGTSPLRDVYTAWRYLQALEELEAMSITKDINGLPVLTLPAQYLSAEASAEQKAILESFKNMLRNLQQGSQSAIILPSAVDEATRTKLFDINLLSVDGKKQFNLDEVKNYYRTLIFVGLGADILMMGNTTVGSNALGNLKNTLTAATAQVFIRRILEVVNRDLIRQIYSLNGWDISRCCYVDCDNVEETDLETLSKAYQRLGATGFLPKTLNVVNRGLSALGVDVLPEGTTQEELEAILPDKTTKSGEGMQEGLNSGTGNADGSSGNASDLNSENIS